MQGMKNCCKLSQKGGISQGTTQTHVDRVVFVCINELFGRVLLELHRGYTYTMYTGAHMHAYTKLGVCGEYERYPAGVG